MTTILSTPSGVATGPSTASVGCDVTVPLFFRNYVSGTLGANATFARSSSATIVDHEGVIRTVPSGAARFNGLRYVRNLITLSSENLQVGWIARDGAVITGQDSVTFGAVNNSRLDRIFILPAYSQKIIYRVDVKADDAGSVGKAFVLQAISGATGGYSTLGSTSYTLTDTYSTIAISFTSHVSDFIVIPLLKCNELTTVKVNITNVQIENVTGQTNQNPSEYVSVGVLSAPYHGANVDGVKYFTTENGNTVTDNVVTEGTGAAITGGYLLMEPAATNLAEWFSEINGTNYSTNSNVVFAANNAVAPDGTTAATRLTAAATSSSGLYAADYVSGSSAVYTYSVFIKRGNCDWVTAGMFSGGVNYRAWFNLASGVTGTQNNCTASIIYVGDGWYRVTVTTSTAMAQELVSAPVPRDADGVVSTTGGYYCLAWGISIETGTTATSPIPTSGTAVTRAAESLSYSGITADNETRAITDAGTVDTDDWDGIVDATINGADNLAKITSIDVYTTGERPA